MALRLSNARRKTFPLESSALQGPEKSGLRGTEYVEEAFPKCCMWARAFISPYSKPRFRRDGFPGTREGAHRQQPVPSNEADCEDVVPFKRIGRANPWHRREVLLRVLECANCQERGSCVGTCGLAQRAREGIVAQASMKERTGLEFCRALSARCWRSGLSRASGRPAFRGSSGS